MEILKDYVCGNSYKTTLCTYSVDACTINWSGCTAINVLRERLYSPLYLFFFKFLASVNE